jgi:hypothetical protein
MVCRYLSFAAVACAGCSAIISLDGLSSDNAQTLIDAGNVGDVVPERGDDAACSGCGRASCLGGGIGAGNDCGLEAVSCCAVLAVPGGTFNRSNDGNYPATLSSFGLDRFEVTVGRFRAFVSAGMGTQASPPLPGSGAHPRIAGSTRVR